MTAIVAIAHDGQIWMGGDSAAGGGNWSVRVRTDRKVVRVGEFLMGFTTSFRMGQLLAHTFVPPRRQVGQDLFAFMVADFVPAIRRCFEAGGWARQDQGVNTGGVFLVGHAGRLFQIDSDFQVAEHADGYSACGCGEDYALGALFATKGKPEDRVRKALEAASAFSGAVLEPFYIEHLPSPTP
jgi:ATP-dependent protease HslVU (ClpYQ) peptidase subunit